MAVWSNTRRLTVLTALCAFASAAISATVVDAAARQREATPPLHRTLQGGTASETILYSFAGNKQYDGEKPYARLMRDASGALYGTTYNGGGTLTCKPITAGCGTVFKLTPSGSTYTERVLYAFQGGPDGAYPNARLYEDKNGVFFGTTTGGGTGQNGTVFKLTQNGSTVTHTVIYAFRGSRKGDGSDPTAPLIGDTSGALYGTTEYGGKGYGTVFKLTPNGSHYSETILHAFTGSDGAYPYGGLEMDGDGNLYGTTVRGGTGGVSFCSGGCGVVFKVSTTELGYPETVLYSFQGFGDGSGPYAGVTFDKSGNVYGTTAYGGYACNQGCGTVYELTPFGSTYGERVLYRFGGPSDGANPKGVVILDKAGDVFGTTTYYGDATCRCGTVFELRRSSGYAETVLHAFTGRPGDGSDPEAGLIVDKTGRLYGTTVYGGSDNDGTVYAVTP